MEIPYFQLYLHGLAFSGAQIGQVLALGALARLYSPVLWGSWADRYASRKPLLLLAVAGCAITTVAVLGSRAFWPVLLVWAVASFFKAPVVPLADAAAWSGCKREGADYGRLRSWGSLGFLVAAVALGPLFQRLPNPWIVGVMAGLLAVSLVPLGAWRIVSPPPPEEGWDLRRLLGRPGVPLFMLLCALVLLNHAAYHGFFSIHLQALGFSKEWIGLSWGVGVLAETLFMRQSARLLDRYPVRGLFRFALGVAALRWGLSAVVSDPWLLLALQSLHAITFGLYHVSALALIDRLFPEPLKASAQGLYTAMAYGLGGGIGSLLAGWAYDAGGGPLAFGGSALIALLAWFLSRWLTPQIPGNRDFVLLNKK